MAKKTSWPVIILGISAFVLVVGVGLVAVVGYVIYQQFAFQAKSATEVSADEQAVFFHGADHIPIQANFACTGLE